MSRIACILIPPVGLEGGKALYFVGALFLRGLSQQGGVPTIHLR